ncbi:hypothetical protein [Patulibacter americanus]|uniref:hypothetical protein n=1 Tax=Patulibacter americanus TaxID=588672 RepID=UPI0003B3E735|nr:hypothetical protein [Patulibacter americanus]
MRRRLPPPWALTALLALLYVATAPPTTDLAAQEHRIQVARDGVWLFDLSWFGGHHLPGYSVLMPLLGLVLGATLIGAGAAVVASWAFARLAGAAWPGRGGTVAAWWFAAGVGGLLFTGRITFVLGTAVALLTLVAVRPSAVRPAGDRGDAPEAASAGRAPVPASAPVPPSAGLSPRRVAAGAVGAVLTALASPVAALFLALVAGAWWLGGVAAPDRRTDPVALVTAGAAFAAALALALGFPTGGSEPFVASALWPGVAVLALALVALPRDARTLRIGVALYLVAVLLSGLLATPMGGNATRLAALAGGPLLAGALWGRRPVALALLALPLLYWQWYPPVRDATQAWGDPSAGVAYWAPARAALDARLAREPGRVEVPPTARRGEARWLPPEIPIARGWIRQLDRDRNARFYADLRPDGPPLSPAEYRRWLDDHAVAWVALPDAPTDEASRDEVALLRAGRVPGLQRAWSNAHWTLWRVEGARPLATWVGTGSGAGDTDGPRPADDGPAPQTGTPAAPASPDATPRPASRPGRARPRNSPDPRVVRLTAGEAVVAVPRAGLVDLRVRWSPFLRASTTAPGARACVARGSGGWARIRTDAPGTVSVGTGPSVPWRAPSRSDCTP